ncbi:MAG: DNA mismatch repair endonuclease MutL [Deltaproteobacteria bacterium]|nr:DNA mismatch repair endonuclease MutL [Deltaproteobacteria bacterium]
MSVKSSADGGGTIKVLDRLVADQIAAGEVVERPGSVVKELVENSLDAGATRIQVDIDAGGVARVRVADNGAGIPAAEVELAFERHATSKIRLLADLDDISSFGFRGEALPSIAAVSRVTVQTRTADAIAGVRVALEAGRVTERKDAGCPVGTDIEVRDLFFNTPARLKFLKAESTEAGHAAEALVRLALMRPDVAFTLTSGGRKARQLPRADRIEERVAGLFPEEPLHRVEGEDLGVGVLAVLGPPERARAGAGSLYTYVNGRFVRDRALLKAVTQGFGGTLDQGRYPAGLVAVTLPPGACDVNVHPQKIEVRFADGRAVYRAVARIVGELASRAVWAVGARAPVRVAATAEGVAEEPALYAHPGRLVPPPQAPRSRTEPPMRPAQPAQPEPEQLAMPSAAAGAGTFSRLRIVGQAKSLFLLLEGDDDLVIVDQHAAHERVTFERLRAALSQGRLASQRLLVPSSVDLGPADAERIAALAPDLGRLGLDVSRSGRDRITIHAVPAEVCDASPSRLLADMVLALEESRGGSRGDADERALAIMACHGSLRAGASVAEAEIAALLRAMDTIDFAGHCPHGRPVLCRIPWSEIRRRVGRG